MENEKIDIEEIMGKIRKEIKEKGYKNEDLSFDDIELITSHASGGADSYEESIEYIGSSFHIQTFFPLEGNPLAVFVKKVIRKLTFFYVNPISDQQTAFNVHLVRIINEQKAMIEELQEDVEYLNKHLKKLENEE